LLFQYEHDFLRRVEKVGTENFPTPGLYGTVRMTVTIDSKGDVTKIFVNGVTGGPGLRDQGIRIIRLSEPFGSFPRDLRALTETVDIAHTFTFSREAPAVRKSE
jgi:protein TonB